MIDFHTPPPLVRIMRLSPTMIHCSLWYKHHTSVVAMKTMQQCATVSSAALLLYTHYIHTHYIYIYIYICIRVNNALPTCAECQLYCRLQRQTCVHMSVCMFRSMRYYMRSFCSISTYLARDSATLRRCSSFLKTETLATPAVLGLPLKLRTVDSSTASASEPCTHHQ
jgi:hypothetical protein